MFSTHDTIVAIATPPGRGGIGTLRISGDRALAIAQGVLDRRAPLTPRHATFCRAVAAEEGTGQAIDHVIATYFPRPRSYTGEDVVELSAHGSPVLLRAIMRAAIAAGARLAEAGEFTFRAYLNGRLDLVQAEAIADLANAVTPLQARVAFDQLEGTLTGAIGRIDATLIDLVSRLEASLDFPDEGYHFVERAEAASALAGMAGAIAALLQSASTGRMIREGRTVAVVGRANVGKSSVFNRVAGIDRAIVTTAAGTTRDLVTETLEMDGVPVTLVDTAGIRTAVDEVEVEGIRRARRAQEVADVVIVLLDGSRPLEEEDRELVESTRKQARVIAVNKTDLPRVWTVKELDLSGERSVEMSAVTGSGIETLCKAVTQSLGIHEPLRDSPVVTNERHAALLKRAQVAIQQAANGVAEERSEEYILADLQIAREAIEEITGRRTQDDVLRHIFERFCIGK